MIGERHYKEELENVIENYPLCPGGTLSHATARFCADRKWIVRDADGNWIPTATGLKVHEEQEAKP